MIDEIILIISFVIVVYCLIKLPKAILNDVKKEVKYDDKENS
jgi:hypothetical protein